MTWVKTDRRCKGCKRLLEESGKAVRCPHCGWMYGSVRDTSKRHRPTKITKV